MHSAGISIDEQGKQHFLDASIAYKRAVLDCINYLHKFGYTKEQVRTCLLACCLNADVACVGKLACGNSAAGAVGDIAAHLLPADSP